MESVVETLIHSPKLIVYYQELREAVEQEQARRRQFYETMTEQEKIEFINGEIVRQSPVKIEHDFVSGKLYILLHTYVTYHNLGYVGHEKMLVSLTRNDYEPDVCYWKKEKADAFQPGQMHFPAPDFVAEVLSPSTAETDRDTKFSDYAAHGAQEYWIIDPVQEIIEQYVLQGEQYELVQKTDSGVLRSPAVEGFRIPAAALFNQQEHLKILREIAGT
jgi:Uma2 family endonuclease